MFLFWFGKNWGVACSGKVCAVCLFGQRLITSYNYLVSPKYPGTWDMTVTLGVWVCFWLGCFLTG